MLNSVFCFYIDSIMLFYFSGKNVDCRKLIFIMNLGVVE